MIPTRATLTIPALVLVLSGCGAVAAMTMRSTTDSVALSGTTRPLPPPVTTAAPTPGPKAPTAPAPVPPAILASGGSVVVTIPGTGTSEWLEILNSAGAVVARTAAEPTDPWMTSAGAGGAYWTQNGLERELTVSGAVRTLGTVPGDANGVVIGPDGVSYAYATSDQSQANGTALNRIVVIRPGAAPEVVADRVSDPNHPTADAPAGWDYYLLSWTTPGITFARVPTGGCGCGSFDMQMQSAFSAIINPSTEAVTALTADNLCPLSQVGPWMETVCFGSTGQGGTASIRIEANGVVTHTYSLSASNVAGDAAFAPNGSALAYITIPDSEDTCGATLTPTLRILDVTTGSATDRNVGDFTPQAWGLNGLLYGQMTDGSVNWVAAVNPMTFAVSRLTASAPGTAFVGII